jgi:hypothetical protein
MKRLIVCCAVIAALLSGCKSAGMVAAGAGETCVFGSEASRQGPTLPARAFRLVSRHRTSQRSNATSQPENK